jgi:hypothetical protein
MNLSKYLILGLLVNNCVASRADIAHIEALLAEKGKAIEKAETLLEILQATGEFTKEISNIKKIYLDLP